MLSLSSDRKIQKVSAICEFLILFWLPFAQFIKTVFSEDYTHTFDSGNIPIWIGFFIFATNILAYIILFFLKRNRRIHSFHMILRIASWMAVIANAIENQLIVDILDTDKTISNFGLAYSCIGVYILTLILLLSMHADIYQQLSVCLMSLYFSIRVSVTINDPILSVFTCLLCLILLGFLTFIRKSSQSMMLKDKAKEMDIFLLKQLLSNTEEGFMIVRNNRSIHYANRKMANLASFSSDDLLATLEHIKRFDVLSSEAQAKIRAEVIDGIIAKEDAGLLNPKDLASPIKSTQCGSMPYTFDLNIRDSYQVDQNNELIIPPISRSIKRNSTILQQQELTPESNIKEQRSLLNSPPKIIETSVDSTIRRKITAKTQVVSSAKEHVRFTFLRRNRSLGQKKPKESSKIFMRKSSTKDSNVIMERTTFNDNTKNVSIKITDYSELPERTQSHNKKAFIFEEPIPDNLHELFAKFGIRPEIFLNHSGQNPQVGLFKYVGYIKDAENHTKLVNVRLQPIISNNQPIMLVYIKDISEKEHYESIKRGEKQKMNMLSSVSHELRTPLNCIITMLDIIENSVSTQLREEYVQPATHSAKLLLSLTNDILDFSQSNANTLKLVYSFFNLKQHLKDIIKLMDIQAKGKGLELILDYDEKLPKRIYSEPNRLRQIIINLIGNALKFTLQGSITLKIEYIEETICKVSVNDTGIGIKSEHMKGLFNKFSKVLESQNMNQQGVGLGLVISNVLAKMLSPNDKGIEVTSRYGHGTTFSFELESKMALAPIDEVEVSETSEDEGSGRLLRNLKSLNIQYNNERVKKPPKSQYFREHSDNSMLKALFSKHSSLLRTFTERDKALLPILSMIDNKSPIKLQHDGRDKKSRVLLSIPLSNHGEKCEQISQFQRALHTFQTIDEKASPIGEHKISSRSKSLFEEEEFVKKMDDKDKLIRTMTYKINIAFDEPYILVVDDNAFNIIALKKLLEGMNLKIDSATNGDAAIQKIIKREEKYPSDPQHYRLILMDCNMPTKDGYETTMEIRGLEKEYGLPRHPIVAVTATTDPREIKKCYEFGMDDYLPKPVNFNIMKDLVIKYVNS